MRPYLLILPLDAHWDSMLKVEAYAVLHVVGLLALLWITLRRYRQEVGPVGPLVDAILFGAPAAMLGARLIGELTRHHDVSGAFAAYGSFSFWWDGNKSAYGGLLAGIGMVALVSRLRGAPVLRLLDSAMPGLAIGTICARLGCFLAGCCYGLPTHSVLGVHFPPSQRGMLALPAGDPRGLFPTQLYNVAVAVLVLIVVEWIRRRGKASPGTRLTVATAIYATGTLLIEFLRADGRRWFVAGLSHSQWISLALLAALACVWLVRRVRDRAPQTLAEALP